MSGNFPEFLESTLERLAEKIAERIRHASAGSADDGPRLFSIEEAARYLGRTSHSVRHLINSGKLLAVRIDDRVFLDRRDLDAAIERAKDGAWGDPATAIKR